MFQHNIILQLGAQLPVKCSLDKLKPEPRPVLRTVRNFRAIDMQQFRQDVALLTAAQLDITADQFKHSCSLHPASGDPRHCSPWYSSIALELRSMKRERRRAERRWLSTGLTIHKKNYELYQAKD